MARSTTLIEQQKEQRRDIILATARRLAARKGIEAVTMRELARASRVSVPTLYSLFGSKEAILLADAERTVKLLVASFDPRETDFLDRILAIYRAGAGVIAAMPDYYRDLLRVLAFSASGGVTRAQIEGGFIDMMAAVLRDGQAEGLLVEWIDPQVLSLEMWSHYVMALGRCALGDLAAEHFLDATTHGMCLVLLGVARGAAHDELERRAHDTHAVVRAIARDRRRDDTQGKESA